MSGLRDKRSMTAASTITLNGAFLSMQLIYGRKTNQSLPKFEFLVGFSCLLIIKTTVILHSP